MLRTYQIDAIDAIRRSFQAGNKRVCLVAPCGAGKTTIFAEIAKLAISKGKRVLFLVHRRELVNQAYERCRAHGLEPGVIMGKDRRANAELPLQIGTIQTLIRRDDIPTADLAVVDEAHHARSDSYKSVLDALPNARVLGLTATPCRADGKGMADLFDDLVEAATYSHLVSLGHLIMPSVFAGEKPDLSGVAVTAGDYNPGQLGSAVNASQLAGNIIEHYEKHGAGRRAVVFAVDINHSKAIYSRFEAAGHAAAHLDCHTPREERDAILQRLVKGEIRVLCNVGILNEGWDLPALEICILARPTKSVGFFLQMTGRVIRPCEGKTQPLILDHAGCCHEFGHPMADREWLLTADDEKGSPPGKICQNCGCCEHLSATECSYCGRELTAAMATGPKKDKTKETEEELKEVTFEQNKIYWQKCDECGVRVNMKAYGRYNLWGKCRSCKATCTRLSAPKTATMEEKKEEHRRLEEVRKRKGFQPGWTIYRYKDTFGVLPRGVKEKADD